MYWVFDGMSMGELVSMVESVKSSLVSVFFVYLCNSLSLEMVLFWGMVICMSVLYGIVYSNHNFL